MDNPLLNSLVIWRVVSYLPLSEQKSCRLVCHLWNEEAGKVVRNGSKVKIDTNLGDKCLLALTNSPCAATFASNFVFGPGVNLSHSVETPAAIGTVGSGCSTIADTFFTRFGPSIKSLSLVNCNCSIDTLKSILYQGCPRLETLKFIAVNSGRLFPESFAVQSRDNVDVQLLPSGGGEVEKVLLPNLKHLHVNVRSSDLVRNTEFMVDLLSISPNLETISWLKLAHDEVSYDRNFQLDLEKAWSALRPANGLTIRDTIYDVAIHYKPLTLPRLAKIDSSMRLSNASLIVLRDRQFPLKFLDIQLTIDVIGSSLRTLLQSLSPTLKSLKIEFYTRPFVDDSSKVTHDFPVMARLEHLFLKTYHNSFGFLRQLSSLRTLSFCEGDVRDSVHQLRRDVTALSPLSASLQRFQAFSEDHPHHSGASGHIGSNNCDRDTSLSPEDICTLATAFPNLHDVRLKGSSQRRRKWIQSFASLRVLEDVASETGIGGLKGPRCDNQECCHCERLSAAT